MVFINNERRELFLHIPKCGGSHIRKYLIEYYDYTQFFDDNKHHKMEDFCDNIDVIVNDKHTITKKGKYRFFLSHQNYNTKYRDYFKYTFVRNPYEKLYSAFKYLKSHIYKGGIRGLYENQEFFVDFKTFIHSKNFINNISFFHAFITQYDQLVNENGIIDMDFIGNVETLDEDFLYLLNLRNIEINENHKKELFENIKTNSTDITNLNLIYDDEILKFVNEYFSIDFEYFGYKKYDTMEDFVDKYYKDIECFQNSKKNLKIYKLLNIVDYNVSLLQKICKEYENLPTIYEYKLESINDNKMVLFFKLFNDIGLLKKMTL
jgi:hypothetical protein